MTRDELSLRLEALIEMTRHSPDRRVALTAAALSTLTGALLGPDDDMERLTTLLDAFARDAITRLQRRQNNLN